MITTPSRELLNKEYAAQTRQCTECGVEKSWFFSHRDYTGKKYYKDASDKLWKGRVCRACLNIRQRKRNLEKKGKL